MQHTNIPEFKYARLVKNIMQAMNPKTLEVLEGQFKKATQEDVDLAMEKSEAAFQEYKNTSGKERAAFLNAIADEIMALGEHLIQRAAAESGLPEGRITGERGRTVNQLRMFARVAEEGYWMEASIDTAIPDRQPVPKPDIRKLMVPVGTVVVFTASNFPLAFSTAGGDTASALAAGNTVVVKAHESHLGTNALIAVAIDRAIRQTGMPEGVFTSLNGFGTDLGQMLARHPKARAIAFTGSFSGGKALFDTAAKREEPIPVFAEMGSINPVVLLNGALSANGEELARKYADSVTLGVGQFCTNPGLLIGEAGPHLEAFIKALAKNMKEISPEIMLNEKVCANYNRMKKEVLETKGVSLEGEARPNGGELEGVPAIAAVSGPDFVQNPGLQEEVFGPFTLVVKCASQTEVLQVVNRLKGQLTATIMAEGGELEQHADIVNALQNKVGRLIFNGVPTGVEVCPSMHHGGPYPSTTDARFTSVGTAAIKRFIRPVAYQDWPRHLLPEALKNENPLNLWRQVNSFWTKDKI